MASLPARPKSPLPTQLEARERARDRDRTAQPMASRPPRDDRPLPERADSRERDTRPYPGRLAPRRDTYIPSSGRGRDPDRRDYDDRDRDRYRDRDDYRKERSGYGPPSRRSPPPYRGRRGGYRGGPPRRYHSPGRGPYRRDSRSRSPRRRSRSPPRRFRSLSRSRSPGRRSPGRRRSPLPRDRDVRQGGYPISDSSRNRSPHRRPGSRSRSRSPRRPLSPRHRSSEERNVKREISRSRSETLKKEDSPVLLDQSTVKQEGEDAPTLSSPAGEGSPMKRSPSPSATLSAPSEELQTQFITVPKEENAASPIIPNISPQDEIKREAPESPDVEELSQMKMEVDAAPSLTLPQKPRSPPREPRAHGISEDHSRRPPTGPRDTRARSPPRGPRGSGHPPRGPAASSSQSQPTTSQPTYPSTSRIPGGPRAHKRKPYTTSKEGTAIHIDDKIIHLPPIPAPTRSKYDFYSEMQANVASARKAINKLTPEVFDLMQSLPRKRHEADMAAYDLSVAEGRRKIAESQLEKAKAGVFGVDCVHEQVEETKA